MAGEEGEVAWRPNARRAVLRRRVRLMMGMSGGLLFLAMMVDALPFDYDLPGVPDLELAVPYVVTLTVLWVIALTFLYASWLLYANAPERIGFYREGIVVGYGRDRPKVAKHLLTFSAPSNVVWKEVRGVVGTGPLHLSRHDLTLRTHRRGSWVLVGLSPELRRAVVEAFEAHLALPTKGWQAYIPVPLSPERGPAPSERRRSV